MPYRLTQVHYTLLDLPDLNVPCLLLTLSLPTGSPHTLTPRGALATACHSGGYDAEFRLELY